MHNCGAHAYIQEKHSHTWNKSLHIHIYAYYILTMYILYHFINMEGHTHIHGIAHKHLEDDPPVLSP